MRALAVTPAVLWWAILIVYGAVRGSAFNGALAKHELFLGGAPGTALFTVLVVAVGEEYLYRGPLLLLAIRADFRRWAWL